MKRREDPLANLGELPDWLPRFELARWIDTDAQPPEGWAFDDATWRHIVAHQRWVDAGRAWLAERGVHRGHFALTRPQAVSR
ncbi:hypothetical protein ACQPZX_29390 [Actinoplanes sp. CA-142083]|uniref:hypothetical protein n=1 Tax=Actinoplanes sp. CA-142083 TaxID=3239903 RepID=UPI003D8CBF0E